MSIVGKNIKKIRIQMGISQYRLAKMSGVAQPTISAIEADGQTRSPATDTVERIARALQVPPSSLMEQNTKLPLVDSRERALLEIFAQLNDAGKAFLLQQAENILSQPAFRQDGSITSAI